MQNIKLAAPIRYGPSRKKVGYGEAKHEIEEKRSFFCISAMSETVMHHISSRYSSFNVQYNDAGM